MAKELLKRKEIKQEYKWRIEDLYENDALWKSDYLELKEAIGKLEAYKGRLAENGGVLLELLRLKDAVDVRFERIYV